jgi:hypothetical protein
MQRLMHLAVFVLLGAMVACTPPYTVPLNPAPGAITLTPSTLAFTATGATNAQPVSASQTNYFGSFAASTTNCSGIATISPSSGTAFTVTPVGTGTCTFTIAGAGATSATLTIGVTTTSIGGS